MTDLRAARPADEAVAVRVRELLARDGWTQRRFAAAIGLEETKLSKSLAGRRRFAADELVRIADVTGETVTRLLHGADPGRARTAAPTGAAAAAGRPDPVPDGDTGPQGTRRRILDAAWTLIADQGYHRVRTADVARAAGTSTAAIHHHFPTRSELLDSALRHNVRLAFDRQVAELDAVADPHARLLRLIELQLPDGALLEREWSIWIQVWAESAIDPARRALYWHAYDRWFRSIAMTLAEGAAAGVFVPDAAEHTRRLTALIDGLGIQVMARTPGTSVAQMRADLAGFLDRAVLRGPGGPSTGTENG
ncbi:TetR/AcrR family transcriptional regulator [Pseudonocardia spirodelae]|uniref:TetR/AcrR family transcriptional regulator n=1 Tax=Pseudonocardia spirodelae TaxID=3133431 RepID=A0ABU8T833_9PSEU